VNSRTHAWRFGFKMALPMLVLFVGMELFFAFLDGTPFGAPLIWRTAGKGVIAASVAGLLYGLFARPKTPNP
jgi:hypothetical protein